MIRAILAGLAAILLAVPALAEVKVQQVTSERGLHAWLVEEHALPFTALEIRFRGGTSLDRPGKRGETRLMAALIEEGAGELDAQAFLPSGFLRFEVAVRVDLVIQSVLLDAARITRGASRPGCVVLDRVGKVFGHQPHPANSQLITVR